MKTIIKAARDLQVSAAAISHLDIFDYSDLNRCNIREARVRYAKDVYELLQVVQNDWDNLRGAFADVLEDNDDVELKRMFGRMDKE